MSSLRHASAALPLESVPEESVPELSVPDESVPELSVPDESVPELSLLPHATAAVKSDANNIDFK